MCRQSGLCNQPVRPVCSWDEPAGESLFLKRDPFEFLIEAIMVLSHLVIVIPLDFHNSKEQSPKLLRLLDGVYLSFGSRKMLDLA